MRRDRVDAPIRAPYRTLVVRMWRAPDGGQRVAVRMRGCERADAAEAVELLNRASETIFADAVRNRIVRRSVR